MGGKGCLNLALVLSFSSRLVVELLNFFWQLLRHGIPTHPHASRMHASKQQLHPITLIAKEIFSKFWPSPPSHPRIIIITARAMRCDGGLDDSGDDLVASVVGMARVGPSAGDPVARGVRRVGRVAGGPSRTKVVRADPKPASSGSLVAILDLGSISFHCSRRWRGRDKFQHGRAARLPLHGALKTAWGQLV